MTSAHHAHRRRPRVHRIGAAACAAAALTGMTGVAGTSAAYAATPWDAQVGAQVDEHVAYAKAEAARYLQAPLDDLERTIGAHPVIDQARDVLGIAAPASAPAPESASASAPANQRVVDEAVSVSANQRVVDAAISRTGAPYVYGAAGPDSFDCSGLVQWSHAQAGKSIPRTSQAQIAGGQPVSLDQLQPGDIVGYLSLIHI